MTQATVPEERAPLPLALIVSANFTAEPIRPVLAHWMRTLELDAAIAFAPPNQIVQHLIDASSELSRNAGGVNVLLVRPDLQSRPDGLAAVDQLADLIDTRARTSEASWIVAVCPPVPPVPCAPSALDGGEVLDGQREADAGGGWEQRIADRLDGTPGVQVIRASDVLRLYEIRSYYDASGQHVADMPYTRTFLAALGTMVARAVHRVVIPPRKVIVLDCDNTLWAGICGEDGPQGVAIDAPRQFLQSFFVERMHNGALLCLCSRNDEADVWRVFDARPDMTLRREHLVAWRINWRPKSENLRALAEELQLDPGAFVFVDDDPAACAEVETQLPQVMTVRIPAAAEQIPSLLTHHWAFDQPRPTDADRIRTRQYQLGRERERCRTEVATAEEFERVLDVHVEIRAAEEPELDRIAQLSYRTTQFNCTLRRRSTAELRQFAARADGVILAVHASDRFGDYGLVGAIIASIRGDALIVDTFLLSCRALGRNVERHMIREVERRARAEDLAIVRLRYVPGVRNGVARAFLESCGPRWRGEDGAVAVASSDAASPDVASPAAASPALEFVYEVGQEVVR